MSRTKEPQSFREHADAFVIRNRREFSFFANSVKKIQDERGIYADTVDYKVIAWNLWGTLTNNQFAQMLIPLVVVSIWNAVAGLLSEQTAAAVARAIFLGRNAITMLAIHLVRRRIGQRESEGLLSKQVTFETTEWTEEGRMDKIKSTKSFAEYDRGEASTFLTQQAVQILIIMFLHSYFGYTTPMAISSILGLQALWKWPLTRLYLIGAEDEEELQRPFKKKDIWATIQDQQDLYAARFGLSTGVKGEKENAAKKLSSKSVRKDHKAKALAERKQL